MKKALSVILSFCLVFVLFSVCSSASEELKLTVSADTHFQCDGDLADMGNSADDIPFCDGMLNRETYFYSSVQGQMNYESEAIFRAMLSDFVNGDSKYLLIAGDITCGKRLSHTKAAELLKQAEDISGKSVFVINGNHDCDDNDFDKYISVDEFKEIYKDLGYDKALSTEPTSASYSADLDGKYRLLAIDSCIYGKDNGQITENVFNWIKEQVELAKKDNKTLIAMMHHSILPHFEVQPMFTGYAKYAEFFADNGIKLVFTGHVHANDISSSTTKGGNTIYDVQTGSLIVSPNAYRVVSLSGGNADITSNYITKIDTGYLPQGYPEEQMKLIENDFAGYSYGYYESGICKWLNRYIGSAYKVSRLLKIEEGTAAYNALDGVMKKIGSSLLLDIYSNGENKSLEDIAQKGGYSLPESDYEKPYQVAARVMYGFYHGDENTVSSDSDFDLLLLIFKAAVTDILATETEIASTELASEILGINVSEELLTSALGFNYSDAMADIIAKSLLQTVAGGIKDDFSTPGDINVTINLSGSDAAAPVLNLFMKIISLITEFLERFAEILVG